jgi:hypothetical protein
MPKRLTTKIAATAITATTRIALTLFNEVAPEKDCEFGRHGAADGARLSIRWSATETR